MCDLNKVWAGWRKQYFCEFNRKIVTTWWHDLCWVLHDNQIVSVRVLNSCWIYNREGNKWTHFSCYFLQYIFLLQSIINDKRKGKIALVLNANLNLIDSCFYLCFSSMHTYLLKRIKFKINKKKLLVFIHNKNMTKLLSNIDILWN